MHEKLDEPGAEVEGCAAAGGVTAAGGGVTAAGGGGENTAGVVVPSWTAVKPDDNASSSSMSPLPLSISQRVAWAVDEVPRLPCASIWAAASFAPLVCVAAAVVDTDA